MKLSRFSKQIIAVVCSIAMLAVGLAFVPANSTKADDYSDLTFKVSNNNPDLAVAFVTQGGVTTEQEVNYCLDQGNNFYCATTAAFTKPNFKTVTCNGNVEDPARAGANFWVPMSVLNDNAYNLVTIEDAVGNTAQFVIRKGTPVDPTESQSVEPSESATVGPTTTAAPTTTPEPTTKSPTVLPDWDTLEWTEVSGMYTDIAYCVVDHTIAGWGRMNFYGVNYMQFVGSGDSKFNEATMEVLDSSANDVTSRLAWNDKAAAIWGKMVSQLGTTDEYYLFTVDNPNTGYVQVAVRVGHPGGEPTSYVPQKPLAPSGLVWAGNDNLPYYFAWGASATPQIDHYNFYVGETKIGESNGTAYDAASYFADAAPGPYSLKVTAVKDDLESDPATLNWTKPYPAGYYNVADYKSTTPYTYPTQEGKIFAGWYTDDTCTTEYTETTGYAYAKFIDEKVLGTKFQVAEDGSAVRFLSSVDSMDYDQVGFKFTGTYGDAVITEKTKTTEKLYTKITAAGESVTPTVFSDESSYFFTYTVRGMTGAGTNSTWNVTPFYVTLDGTTVEGTPGEFPQN
ncbi:MAG: hypothetical protein IJ883_02325 [Eubacterium sp.]|nr:hypothetical protein [Eubacterium sp.]